jgi:hypothetical protein
MIPISPLGPTVCDRGESSYLPGWFEDEIPFGVGIGNGIERKWMPFGHELQDGPYSAKGAANAALTEPIAIPMPTPIPS